MQRKVQARPAGGKGEADWLSEEGDLGSRQGMGAAREAGGAPAVLPRHGQNPIPRSSNSSHWKALDREASQVWMGTWSAARFQVRL